MDDGHSAGERLEDDVRARVTDLRMEEHVRTAIEIRSVPLRVPADELDAVLEAEFADQLLAADDGASDEQARVGHEGERLERDRQPIGLRLVPAEEDHRRAWRRHAGRRELRRVDGVVEDLPALRLHADEAVGRLLGERALVDDVGGGSEHEPVARVEALGFRARPGRIRHAVLVDDDRRAAALGELDRGLGVRRQRARP